MRKPTLIIGILINLLSYVQTSQCGEIRAPECDKLNPSPRIIFQTSYGQLVHDISTPQKQIQALSSRPEKGILIDGLATAETIGSVRISKARGIKLDDGSYCILPQEVEVYFGYVNPTIYIAKEYPTDSCRFSLLIRHEQTHQRINILTLEYFLPLIKIAAQGIIQQSPSVKISTPQETKEALRNLQEYYIYMLMPLIEKFNLAREQEHRKLDNQTNYAMERDICTKFDFPQNN